MDKFTVRNSDGSVNVSQSTAAYTKALTDWVASNQTPVADLERAVDSVFDAHSSRIPMPALISLAVQNLSSDPTQFQALSGRVRTYVKSQCGEGGRLQVVKGTHGGVERLARPSESLDSAE
jgi:hypothetical protein